MVNEPVISVVEDDPLVRTSIGRLLKSFGYTVAVFSSAGDFLKSPFSAGSACLIADIHMPEMTGLELHRLLVDAGRAMPTIFITAGPGAAVGRTVNGREVCYLFKPFAGNELIHCVRQALGQDDPPG